MENSMHCNDPHLSKLRLASNFIEPHSVGTNKSTKVESRHLAHGRLTKNPLKTGDSCSANLISIRF